MSVSIVTQEDLKQFKTELIDEIQGLFNRKDSNSKRWLRSNEVRQLLGNISPGKLQDMRNKGELPFTRIGGTLFYDPTDVAKIMEKSKQHNS
jgi:hypothetical protein